MTDNFDELERLLKQTPIPKSGEEAKKSAIFNALSEFDKKNAASRQGKRFADRLTDISNTLFGGFSMRQAYIVAGGLCAGVFTVALLSTSYLAQPRLPQQPEAVVTAPETDLSINVTRQEEGAAKPDASPAPAIAPAAPALQLEQAPAGYAVAEPKKEMRAKVSAAPAHNMAMDAVGGIAAERHAVMPTPDMQPQYYHDEGRDKFEDLKPNPVKVVTEEPVSTFSIDVDTSSYAFMRASLNNNVLPQKDAVRIEELINYFPYDYPLPESKEEPFKASVSVFPTPWNPNTKLMHVGIKGYQLQQKEKPRSNLVFLLDTSGSMNEPNKLPLLQNSMKLLLDSLSPEDTVAIVTYAGSAGTVLEPTKVKDKTKILNALDNLNAGGSTAGAEGIRQAYQLAEQSFDKEGINRVILATDGDFNVGITSPDELQSFIERKRETGIFLSVLGFGRGNYNDALMQKLAQNGNGNAAYIDNLNEARKVLVTEASSTLFPIATDVKIQVEFNPAQVAEYRLIGYETRLLNREDFNNDKVDAGDIGAGHTVTAIYEITPVDSKAKLVDGLRYQQPEAQKPEGGEEYAFLKIRYKLPESSTSKLITTPVNKDNEKATEAGNEARFAAAVAAFGQLLRGDSHTASYTYDDVIALAQAAKGADPYGYRAEFINLVRLAKQAGGMQPLQNPQ